EAVTAHIAGYCASPDTIDERAGAGLSFGPGDGRNVALRVPAGVQSSLAGEILAIILAARATLPFAPLHIVSRSSYAIDSLTVHLPRWRDNGWIGVANATLLRCAAYHLQTRSAVTTFRWSPSNDGDAALPADDDASALARAGSTQDPPTDLDLSVPDRWNTTGARLTSLTQSLAYQGVRATRKTTHRRAADGNIARVQHCTTDHLGGGRPLPHSVWKGLRHKDTTRNISDFLWKTTHNALKVGAYWQHIPDFEFRGLCGLCQQEESMEHILAECASPECSRVWQLCRALWERKAPSIPWPGERLGNILGAPLASFHTASGRPAPGASRLYRIMMTESAHLIWRLRCERVIDRCDDEFPLHTHHEIDARWLAAMNARLTLDRELTKHKYGTRRLPRATVLRTWSGTLRDEHHLPDDWLNTGFLVG
ncbi:hypothetical protein BDW22DRAFT_1316404, partial [Trametopsis cervina]